MTKAAERSSPFTLFVESFEMVMAKIMAPAGDPISPPIPTLKPERATKSAPDKPEIIAQCGYGSISAVLDKDGETPIYRATFDPGMAEDMAAEGCAQFFQGCNTCTIQYEGCDAAVKAACTSAACLEEKCERRVICSAKRCEAKGKPGGNPPSCSSRLVRTSCLRKAF